MDRRRLQVPMNAVMLCCRQGKPLIASNQTFLSPSSPLLPSSARIPSNQTFLSHLSPHFHTTRSPSQQTLPYPEPKDGENF